MSDSRFEREEQNPCPPDIKAAISSMEDLLMRDPLFNHAGFPTQMAIDLIKQGQIDSFAQFEKWLRELGSKIYFLALPLDYYPPPWDRATQFPWPSDEKPKYTLWVAVNGEEEAQALLGELQITVGENASRLRETGVLILPEDARIRY
ncbi:MAG TPA: hypothetical protein VLG37_01205 [Candidatus Saccharimonadales bacterium]|nr:hypothetical protein [Candidatus Saccharimonadales bacterium]